MSDIEIEEELEIIEENAENQQIDDDDDQEQNDEAEEAAEKKLVKPKRVITNPRVKLNDQTLKSNKGLVAIPALFKRQKFKGHGHEENDLRVLMKTYEYWCHRMFPKYPFDECVEKIEMLGNKKSVITLIKKIRLGIEVEEERPVQDKDDSDVEEDAQPAIGETINDTRFDALLDRPEPTELTEEQVERIRVNKENAIKLRQERLRQIRELAASKLQNAFPPEIEETVNNEDDSHDEQKRLRQIQEAAARKLDNAFPPGIETKHNEDKSDDEDMSRRAKEKFSDNDESVSDDDQPIIKTKRKAVHHFSDSENEFDADQPEVGNKVKLADVIENDRSKVGNEKDQSDVGSENDQFDVGSEKDQSEVVNEKNQSEVGNEKYKSEAGNETDQSEVNEKNQSEVGNEKYKSEAGNEKDQSEIGNEKDQSEVGNEKDQSEVESNSSGTQQDNIGLKLADVDMNEGGCEAIEGMDCD